MIQLALLPAVMQMTEGHAQLCGIHVDLLSNGYAVLRITICLQEQETDPFMHYPMKRCYLHLEVPHFIAEAEKDGTYRRISHSDEGVEDLLFTIQHYIEILRVFTGIINVPGVSVYGLGVSIWSLMVLATGMFGWKQYRKRTYQVEKIERD